MQDLITQIYFKGDSLIEQDEAASAPTAINRILSISKNNRNKKQLQFDVVLAKELVPEDHVFQQLVGLYRMNDKSTMEFSREGDLLLLKWNRQIREAMCYKGNNEFHGGVNNATAAKFQLLSDQKTKLTIHYNAPALKKNLTWKG